MTTKSRSALNVPASADREKAMALLDQERPTCQIHAWASTCPDRGQEETPSRYSISYDRASKPPLNIPRCFTLSFSYLHSPGFTFLSDRSFIIPSRHAARLAPFCACYLLLALFSLLFSIGSPFRTRKLHTSKDTTTSHLEILFLVKVAHERAHCRPRQKRWMLLDVFSEDNIVDSSRVVFNLIERGCMLTIAPSRFAVVSAALTAVQPAWAACQRHYVLLCRDGEQRTMQLPNVGPRVLCRVKVAHELGSRPRVRHLAARKH